jgi:hypothetical protein
VGADCEMHPVVEKGPASLRPARSSLPRTPQWGLSGAASVHGGPASVLALQRAVGNAAVAREIASKRPQLQRACCPSCANGHRCEAEEEGEVERAAARALHRAVLARRASDGKDSLSPVPRVTAASARVPQAD